MAALFVCQLAVVVGYFCYDRNGLRSQGSSLLHDPLVPLTTPLWICLPYALVAESALRRLKFALLAVLPVIAIVPVVWLVADSVMEGGASAGHAVRTGGWLTLIFLTYWAPLLAIWQRQRTRARGNTRVHGHVVSKRGWFCCRHCWRPMKWDLQHPLRHVLLLILMRPAVCESCRTRRVAPIFWRHRTE